MNREITIRMPKELLAKWLAALRSGEYKQATGWLSRDGGYCCLGVLQTLACGDVERDFRGNPLSVPTSTWLDAQSIDFRNSRNLNHYVPWLPSLKVYAAEANDGIDCEQSTFAEIADAIEACSEGF